MKSRIITAICLCFLICCSCFLCACNKKTATDTNEASSDETASTDEVSFTTTVNITDVYIPVTETTELLKTEPTTQSQTQSENKPQSNSGSDSQNQSSNSQDNNPNSGYADSTTSTCTITVGNKDYIAQKGSIVTYTYCLKTPKAVENVQAEVTYSPECLEYVDDKIENQLPVINSGAVINGADPGSVKYNAVNIAGFDFTTEEKLITLKFKVTAGGTASIANAIEFMDEKGGTPYVELYKFAPDVKYRETLET